jgi:hypothetical protein
MPTCEGGKAHAPSVESYLVNLNPLENEFQMKTVKFSWNLLWFSLACTDQHHFYRLFPVTTDAKHLLVEMLRMCEVE